MHPYHTPHTWMHRHHHPSSECTGILPLTHEYTINRHSPGKCTDIPPLTHESKEIIIPQVNAPESYPSHTWMHRNRHSSGKCTYILPLTHECTEKVIPQVNAPESWPHTHKGTEIVTPQVNALISYPSQINAPKSSSLKWMHRNLDPDTWMHPKHHSSGKCTNTLPLTHECTDVIIPQVHAPESYPSHMNAPKSSLLK